ncbi:MAG: hypothetical protein SGI99_04915 [Pseudomonadota bacterium]|nr:hypothetical protein [Pseudomonadota bacterium]
MNQPVEQQLSAALAAHVQATAAVAEAAVNAAQRNLTARLLQAGETKPTLGSRRLVFAAVMSLTACALIILPLLPDSGRAFAAVRAHFLDFKTLAMQVEQRFNGEAVQTSQILVGADGSVRTDVGDQLSIIVDNTRRQLLTLLHDSREASLMPLPALPSTPHASLDWLEEIRQFQGKAARLKHTRSIDGRQAQGWALDLGATQLVLWVDAEGLPIAMEQDASAGLETRYRFQFNVPVPPGRLSSTVPMGYTLQVQEQE